jgi:hypothetical protein
MAVVLRMGFRHGQDTARAAKEQVRAAAANAVKELEQEHVKGLEQERVWGFDVGRRLERAFQASKAPSSPLPTPTVSVSTQTTIAWHYDISPTVD